MPRSARLALFALLVSSLASSQVTVTHQEGSIHGFLVLRSEPGEILATGDVNQTLKAGRVTARTTFRFKDGSFREETAVYTEKSVFRLISDHLIEKGPSFPRPIDMHIDALSGNVSVRSLDGKQEAKTEHIAIPANLVNGILTTVIKDLATNAATTLAMIVATPKPRLVKLEVSYVGEEPFWVGGTELKARHFTVKIELKGLAGIVAPVIGKEPPDLNIWIYNDSVPAFLRSQAPLYEGGPTWTIELASPVWTEPKGSR